MDNTESNFNILVDDKLCNEIFNSRKDSVVCYIKKHFIENENYIIIYPNKTKQINGSGGKNRQDYKLTSESFDLLKNSYKLRQIELSKKNITHPILIYIETATIGFISEIFKDFNMKNKSLNYLNFVFLTYLKKLKLKKADSTTKNFVQNLNFSNKLSVKSRKKNL
jgi:hypothetical protein